MARHLELDQKSRNELVEEARALGVDRPERMTRVELADEIVRRTTPADQQAEARGLFGVARSMLASVVESGLNLPDAASMIRGNVTAGIPVNNQTPVATVTLAEIYAAQGHKARALRMLDEVLLQEPDHVEAMRVRSELLRSDDPGAEAALAEVRKSAAPVKTSPKPVRVAESGATPDYVPGGFLETTGEEIQTGKPPQVEEQPALPEEQPALPEEQRAPTEQQPVPVSVAASEADAAHAPAEDARAEHAPAEVTPVGAARLETPAAESTTTSVPLEETLVELAPSGSQSFPTMEPLATPAEAIEPRGDTVVGAVPMAADAALSSLIEPAVGLDSNFSPAGALYEAVEPAQESVAPAPCHLVLSRAGGTLHLYWELAQQALRSILAENGAPVVRIVSFTPTSGLPARFEMTLPLEDGESVDDIAGRTSLGGFEESAVIRAALGWLAEEEFLPVVVGRTIEQLRVEGETGLVARAEGHLLDRAAL